ncbi:MAG: FAD-dependent oxidoreductase [Bryobacter sp.]|nr:FAD-dependent oxidoreductase [Bryobacter sp.]
MRRRDLLAGYSLVVLADKLPAAPQAPSINDRMRKEFDRLAPPNPIVNLGGEPHMVTVDLECDVFVAGGGLAGVCAAISAARHGAKVILVQDRSRLGGNSSSEVKMHVVGSNSHKGRPGWREGGLLEEIRLDDAANNPQRCWEMWDLLLYDKCVSEPNLSVLLETTLFHAQVKDGVIQQVLCRCDKSEHLYRIRAKNFIDATGDSRLGLEAGAEMRTGREGRDEFKESLAPEKPDEETLGSSILFTSRLHNKPMPFTPPSWARKVTKEALRFRKINSWEYGYWWIEWGGNISTIRDNERIRFELLSILMGVWDYIKNSGEHTDSRNWALDWIGMMPGKRGSRRLVGDHLLTEHDLLKATFPDTVAIGGWPMDDHPPGGFDRADLPPNTVLRTPEVFGIPLRSLYSKNIRNLMMAGRNISATHAAFTSTRVMGTCAVVGQAAGTAAALCTDRGISPRQLAQDAKLVSKLQQILLRDDQTIQGEYPKLLTNLDEEDFARRATVRASHEEGSAKAALILDGITRDIPRKPEPEIHHWRAPISTQPWIELSWDRPRKLREIQLTFDTGFQRELTLTSSDGANRSIVRAPQPETLRDYAIDLITAKGEEKKDAVVVTKNHQRLRRHKFDPVEVKAVRLRALATNGDDFARLFEVRCYA